MNQGSSPCSRTRRYARPLRGEPGMDSLCRKESIVARLRARARRSACAEGFGNPGARRGNRGGSCGLGTVSGECGGTDAACDSQHVPSRESSDTLSLAQAASRDTGC